MTKVLVLGATGLLGFTVFNELARDANYNVFATLRSSSYLQKFADKYREKLFTNVDVLNTDALLDVLSAVKPDIIINCIGIIKQLDAAFDPLKVLPINSLFPHHLVKLASLFDARVIHISTDCVFSGSKGNYSESDISDAYDLYGKSKFIGELSNYSNAITLRTSIIGHELQSSKSLVDWFLTQSGRVNGYTNAIYTGFPTIEIVNIIKNYVIADKNLSGVYHVSSSAIDKYNLLKLIKETYQKDIEIIQDNSVNIDRSLDSKRFQKITGYVPPSWPELILAMHENYLAHYKSYTNAKIPVNN